MRSDTLGLSHFEQIYAASPDPWHFESSAYEAAKYAATLAALPKPRYPRALDVGCSVGVMTAALAARCDDLLAIEPVATALTRAKARNANNRHVRFAGLFVPRDWPDEMFDLIVISEVLDYLGATDISALARRLRASLAPGGDLVLVHWVRKKGDVPTAGEATDQLIAEAGDLLVTIQATRNRDYRLDVLRRR